MAKSAKPVVRWVTTYGGRPTSSSAPPGLEPRAKSRVLVDKAMWPETSILSADRERTATDQLHCRAGNSATSLAPIRGQHLPPDDWFGRNDRSALLRARHLPAARNGHPSHVCAGAVGVGPAQTARAETGRRRDGGGGRLRRQSFCSAWSWPASLRASPRTCRSTRTTSRPRCSPSRTRTSVPDSTGGFPNCSRGSAIRSRKNSLRPLDEVAPAEPAAPPPLPVQVVDPTPQPLQVLQTIIGPLVEPLATGGIVIVVVIFMLLKREDLRGSLHTACRRRRHPSHDRGHSRMRESGSASIC